MIMNIILVLFLFLFLLFYKEPFIVQSPDNYKKILFDNLQKQITSKHDNRNTKIKKMVKHLLDKVKNDINSTGGFLNMVNMNNKDANGCILFRPMAADLTEQIIEDEIAGGVTIKTTIEGSINKFVEDYDYLLYTYYTIPKNTIYTTELVVSEKRDIPFSVKEYYLKDLKDILETAYPQFDNGGLVLYDSLLIKNSLIKTLNNFNFKDLPTTLTTMLQELDMKQCGVNKKCCA